MTLKIGTINPTASSGPTGPTGATGPIGSTGVTGASGPAGASGAPATGGGGGGVVGRYIDATMTITHHGVTPLFDPIVVAPGETWSFQASIQYASDDAAIDYLAFAPQPFVGLTYLTIDGELYYTQNDPSWPAKRLTLMLAGILDLRGNDTGPVVSLEAANTFYRATLRWIVRNTSGGPINVTANAQLPSPDATWNVQIGAGSILIGTPITATLSSTSGTTVT